MKKILVAIDGSKSSIESAKKGIKIAKLAGSEITFLKIVDLPPNTNYIAASGFITESYLNSLHTLEKEAVERDHKILDSLIEKLNLSGLKYEKKVLVGKPADTIIKLAHDDNYDLIVMGSHGFTPIKRFYTGSVAMRVISDAGCSVLIGI